MFYVSSSGLRKAYIIVYIGSSPTKLVTNFLFYISFK